MKVPQCQLGSESDKNNHGVFEPKEFTCEPVADLCPAVQAKIVENNFAETISAGAVGKSENLECRVGANF